MLAQHVLSASIAYLACIVCADDYGRMNLITITVSTRLRRSDSHILCECVFVCIDSYHNDSSHF